MWSVPAVILMFSVAQANTFPAPGFAGPVSGVWYAGGSASSAMPLGALGTGFIDLTSGGAFGSSTAENTWLKPQPVPPQSGLALRVGDKVAQLLPGTAVPASLRFWGHYPAADMDLGDTFGDVGVYVRAFAPFVPHDYTLSNLPVALFRIIASNRGQSAKPVEIGLQWQTAAVPGTKSQGNVEAVLGWRRDTLAPGKSWKVAPTFIFAARRDRLAELVRNIDISSKSMLGAQVPEGMAYACDDVTDFFLDALGGFNWETRKQPSAMFGGVPNIRQVLWNLNYGDQRAGHGVEGPYGLRSTAFPTRTKDGTLEIRLRVAHAGPNCLALVFTLLNVSGQTVRDLRFGFAANADVGGPDQAENQRAEYDKDLGAAVFENTRTGVAVAVEGRADDCIVGTWPNAHAAMLNNEWVSTEAAPEKPLVARIAEGLQVKDTRGSYALGTLGGPGWEVKHTQADNGVLRSQAVRTLAAGETAELVLGLAWHFPYWTSSDGERLQHRYAASYEDAGQVLAFALPRAGEIEKRIIAWQQAIYASPTTLPLLKDAAINSLYVLARNSWWIADGRFFQSESFTGCPITETFVCRFNGSFPLALLFPECEKATMRSVAAAQAPSGEIPFAFGAPMGSKSPYYHVQHPIVSSEFALVTWRNYVLWKDEAYLEEMYPRVQAALRFAMSLDSDRDGIVNEDPGSEKGFPANQYYDIWPWWGTSAYTGSIWLAALRAGEEMAKKRGDGAFADEMRRWYQAASASFHQKLWTGAYYRLYNDPVGKRVSETSLTNALCGQWFAYATGLGDIVPRSNVLSVIDTVLRWNVAATPCGAVNGVKTDGTPDTTFPDHSAVITIGETWNFCAMAAFAGRIEDAMRVFVNSYGNILAKQKTPWNIPWSLDATTGAIKWGINYYSNPCVWTLFQVFDPATYQRLGVSVATKGG